MTFEWIALAKEHVPPRLDIGSRFCSRHSVRSAVHADDFARVANQVGHEERDVSCATADVEDAHPGDDSGITEKSLRGAVGDLVGRRQEISVRIAMESGRSIN